MRSLMRIATGLAIFGLACGRLAAQEPAPAPDPDSPPPAAASSDPAPETVAAPSDPFPADAPSSDETAQASSNPAEPAAEPAAASADAPGAEARIEASTLEPAAAPPAVDVSAAVSPASEETPGGRRSSDWIFVGIVALAAAVILRRVARGERDQARESVSIHGSVEALDEPALESSGPPILRPANGTSRFERNGRVRA